MNFLARTAFALALLFFPISVARADTYYVSAAGNDASDGRSEATAWRSLERVSTASATLHAGDSVLFRRGDTFTGTLRITASGAAGMPVTLGAFGSGARPVLSGFTTLHTWTSVGTNLWDAPVPGTVSMVRSVVAEGAVLPIGRYPRATAPNAGYLTPDAHVGHASLTDSDLAGGPNFTGGEVVTRLVHWVLNRARITSHTGNTIAFTNAPDAYNYDLQDGYGYFIQNHPATLVADGDWYFDTSARRLRVYYSHAPPDVLVSTSDVVLSITESRNIVISGLAFVGANDDGVHVNNTSFIDIEDCDFSFHGRHALFVNNTSSVRITNNTITDSLNNGIYVYDPHANDVTVRGNRIVRSGAIAGMGASDNTTYQALTVTVQNRATIEENTILDAGYIGIGFYGSDMLIQHNVVRRFCFVKDDGGALYAWTGTAADAPTYTNRVLRENILVDGIGAPQGIGPGEESEVHGIYLDFNTANVSAERNAIAHVAGTAFFTNNPVNFHASGNNVYDVSRSIELARFVVGPGIDVAFPITGLDIQDNVFVQLSTHDTFLAYGDYGVNVPTPSTVEARIASMGTIDRNYQNDLNPTGYFYFYKLDRSSPQLASPSLSLGSWRRVSGFDAHTQIIALPDHRVRTMSATNLYANGEFETAATVSSVGSFSENGGHRLRHDATSRLTGTGSVAVDVPTPREGLYTIVFDAIGPVDAGHDYILRVSTRGTNEEGVIRAGLRETAAPYGDLAPQTSRAFGTARVDHAFLIHAPRTVAGASWQIQLNQSAGTVYLDSISVVQAEADAVSVEAQTRIETNETPTPRVVALDGTYRDARGGLYCGALTLAPFASIILIRSEDACVVPDAGIGDLDAAAFDAARFDAPGLDAYGPDAGAMSAVDAAGLDAPGLDANAGNTPNTLSGGCTCRVGTSRSAHTKVAMLISLMLAALLVRRRRA